MATHDKFNEATRVQMPALVHLHRLGYNYFGKISEDMANNVYDPETNILIDVFKNQFKALNPDHSSDAEQVLKTIRQELDNDDLGRSFYKRLTTVSPIKLVDFTTPDNNVYHCTAEFTCKRDQDEFRPDITLFVNGLPLVFIEVKKPNNPGGMVAESTRMNKHRFPNKKFRRFINITQLMIFSNNMEYDTMGGIVPIQGAFYCTASRDKAPFNCFREENPTGAKVAPYIKDYPYKEIDPAVEKRILSDFNCQVIHTAPEYQTNLNVNTPTMRSVLMGSEYPVMDTPHFLCSKLGNGFIAEQAPLLDAKELDPVLCKQVDVPLCHAPLAAYAVNALDQHQIHLTSEDGLCDLLERRAV